MITVALRAGREGLEATKRTKLLRETFLIFVALVPSSIRAVAKRCRDAIAA
jgi:hypothetical protein